MLSNSHRNAAKALRYLMAPRLGPLLRLSRLKTARLWSLLDKTWGQRHNLANLYEKGDGVPRNLAEARRWYTEVVEKAGDRELVEGRPACSRPARRPAARAL